MAAATVIVSIILKQLLSISAHKVQKKVRLVTGVTKEIKKLTSNFQAIQAVLIDAEQRQFKERVVADWLDKLIDVSYDMDDVLDEWNTAILKLQIEGVENALIPKKKVCFCFPLPRFFIKRVVLRRDIGPKIKEINESLDSIAKEKDIYNLKMVRSTEETERLKTTSFVDVSRIVGRDTEKNILISKLLSKDPNEEKNLLVISIVGMGGLGKTTLAQLAYNDKDVQSNFQKIIWVCVSDLFDEIRIAKAIIEGFIDDVSKFVELQSLLKCIQDFVVETKFLLILDDVWIEDNGKWEPLYNTLNNGLHGSKILVTTRKTTVAHMMRSTDTINIKELSKDGSWLLFKQSAFSGRSQQECEILVDIGREIVSKCKGLPLAIKTVSSLLRFRKTREQWKRILDSEMWELEELQDVFRPLLLSYNDLHSKVKQCFSYCAIFPKAYNIKKDKLVKLWMAQGYFGLEQNRDLEVIGEEYFDILAMRSFFQEFEKDEDDNIIGCKMHDIVHDFALFLVKKEGFAMEINSLEVAGLNSSYEKVHHLTLIINNNEASFPLKNKSSIQKLRSLLVQVGCYNDSLIDSELLQSHLFEHLTRLRLLDLNMIGYDSRLDPPIRNIPKEIGKLIHLRYLNTRGLGIKELPDTLCDLYNLQTLDVSHCEELKKLPQGMSKLVNLRHLNLDESYNLKYMPKGVEKLTNLRTLSTLIVGVIDGSDPRVSDVCSHLGCLKNFNNLRGQISLFLADYALDEEEAKKAQLKNKENIVGLCLWLAKSSEEASSNKDEAVLEALESPPYLKELEVSGYGGIAFPNWIVSLTHLRQIFLNDALHCEYLPALGKLPLLKTLKIRYMMRLKRVGKEFLGVENRSSSASLSSPFIAFPKLMHLTFYGMTEWEEWDYENTKDTIIMPCLAYVYISSCPKLKAMPDPRLHSTSLKQLLISGCSLLEKWCKTKGILFD